MKCFVFSLVIVGALAELPRFRPARFRFQRQELAPTTTDSPTEPTTPPSGPYPPSGWKPAGQPFTLPQEEIDNNQVDNAPYPPSGWKPAQPFALPNEPPATSYGVPDNTYGVPENVYGAPDNTYGAPDSTSTTDATTTDNPQAERLDGPIDVQKSVGTYYVLLPNGQLQKVGFVTENDIQNMKYTARLQLRERAPLLVFAP
ncbi:hypothetical protein K1T71_001493 [Dendrolimus kikuchii]|uniref:Uncharacterized protein n=1 Tax=Dendrolimus kikuchii TaxID=765133 RepID=A0ACC1DJF0_9NEOP|nr:hypothetical protein K1T71_001493 [Dendrolimus kikuchii]